MGAIRNDNFDIEFIERTKIIIDNYNGKYNITLLLNCLLGLIILPSEFYGKKSRAFFDQDISEIPALSELIEGITFNPTRRKNKKVFISERKSFGTLIRKVRNGISHQQIECRENNGKWEGVIIRDFNKGNRDNLELEVNWTIAQLKEFAFYVADNYKIEILRLDQFAKQKQHKEISIYS